MIDVADSNAVYYYHFDGLGSVVALSDSNGDSCQSYEYSVYGQVAAEDPNHTNPYMFTGRRFDFETGLYYYRARYYNPYIGRFLQTDPVGYGAEADILKDIKNVSSAGWELSKGDTTLFLAIKALQFMGTFSPIEISMMEDKGWRIFNNEERKIEFGGSANGYLGTTIYWDPEEEFFRAKGAPARHWNNYPALAGLAHEMGHAWDIVYKGWTTQKSAILRENSARYACYRLLPEYGNIWPRPLKGDRDLGRTIKRAWKNYFRTYLILGKD